MVLERSRCVIGLAFIVLFLGLLALPPQVDAAGRSDKLLQPGGVDTIWKPVIKRLVADGFDPAQVRALFATPGLTFGPEYMGKKMRALYRTKYRPRLPKKAQTAKAKTKRRRVTIYDYHIPPERLAKVRYMFWENQDVLAKVEKKFGVPREVVLAFMVIETRVGDYMGEQTAFRSLASMASTSKFTEVKSHFEGIKVSAARKKWVEKKMRQKANWAYTQLKALITYASMNNMDPVRIPGSIYGAFGLCQFIPTSALERGKDGDGDGYCNLFVPADAIMSIGNFLKMVGWKPGLSKKRQIAVIKRYNQDTAYAKMVLEIARRL